MSAEVVGNEPNFTLRDEIKAYWSARAAGFDEAPGHRIATAEERAAWHRLIERHLGRGTGRRALDLASGTGEIAGLMDDLGFAVTGLDWSEQMLEIAAAKARKDGREIVFRTADAECTMEPERSHDVLIARHLVWTLVDPPAAFAEWRRILVPGGRLLIVDGDFVNAGIAERGLKWLAKKLAGSSGAADRPALSDEMAAAHASILERVYFNRGARCDRVVALLAGAGFVDITVDTDFKAVHRAQRGQFGLLSSLQRSFQHRYAISAGRSAD